MPITNPIYEFNVCEYSHSHAITSNFDRVLRLLLLDETGSWDPTLSAFTPTKYLGTPNSSVCVTGFDQASFIEATSSGLFEQFNTSVTRILFFFMAPLFH